MKLERGDYQNGYRAYTILSAMKNLIDSAPRGEFVSIDVDRDDPLGFPEVQAIRMTIHKLSKAHGFSYTTRADGETLMIYLR